jgi:hypothetical protein
MYPLEWYDQCKKLQCLTHYSLWELSLAVKRILPISHHFQVAETFTLRNIILNADCKRHMWELKGELGIWNLVQVREWSPLRTKLIFTRILPTCQCFQVGEFLTLQLIGLHCWIEEIHLCPGWKQSKVEAQGFYTLFPSENRVILSKEYPHLP